MKSKLLWCSVAVAAFGTVVYAATVVVQFIPNGVDRKIDKPEPPNCHYY